MEKRFKNTVDARTFSEEAKGNLGIVNISFPKQVLIYKDGHLAVTIHENGKVVKSPYADGEGFYGKEKCLADVKAHGRSMYAVWAEVK